MTPSFRDPHHTFDAALLAAGASGSGDSEPPPTAAGFMRQAEESSRALLAHAGGLGTPDPAGTEVGVRRFVELATACARPIAEAPRLAEAIRSSLAGKVGEVADVGAVAGYPDSPAAREMLNLNLIAYGVSQDPAGRELLLELSARRTAERLRADLPDVWRLVEGHLEEYGWVRTWNAGLPPLGAKEVVQRIQNALLRWDTHTLGVAAGELKPAGRGRPAPTLPEQAQPLAAAWRQLAGGLAFSPALFTKARWVSRPFWDLVAGACGCPPDLVPWATPEEVLAALVGDARLEQAELEARRANGFTLHAGDRVHAHALESPSEPRGRLSGQSVSLGRAVGRAKVVIDADEGGKLLPGDVLVTDLSTPTYEGQPSVFPYRGIPSVAIEKAAAVVTDEGGLLSHAAIVCRESRVPSVLGTESATALLKDGMIVEVDATRAAGTVVVLEG